MSNQRTALPYRVTLGLALALLAGCRAPAREPGAMPGAHPNHPHWRSPAELPVEEVPPELKVAFIGDQGLGRDARAVLEMIAAEGAQAVLHQGDFDYDDDPAAWEEQLDEALGRDFPYFVSPGNHDVEAWDGADGYQARIAARYERLGIPWRGDAGELCAIRWRGLLLLFTSPGVFDDDEDGEVAAAFIRDELARDQASRWRICSWHKNQHRMQTGNKKDETGWGPYEASRRGGAIVATGHEHAYSRSHLLASCEEQVVASADSPLQLAIDDPATPADEGRTFVFVSGIAGKSIRDQRRGGDWWAAVSTRDKGAQPGALFGVFNHQGDPGLARFYFKEVGGRIVDEFLVRAPR